MKNKNQLLDVILDRVEKSFNPVSIFLFGSRAKNDYIRDSDYEIGVLFNKKNYIDEEKLIKTIKPPHNIRIYPYRHESLLKYNIDVPFQINIFLHEMILSGKTLRGKRIIENIPPPPITVVDLMQDLKFSIARGSDAIVSYSNGDMKTSSILFYKSCLFGTRDLIILSLKKFPISYSDIYKTSKKLGPKEFNKKYKNIVNSAYRIRNGHSLKGGDLLKNILYLNKFVEKKLRTYYKKRGNKTLIESGAQRSGCLPTYRKNGNSNVISPDNKDEFFMKIAIKEAEKSLKHHGLPIGAVIIEGTRIIGKDHNRVLQKNKRILHAEIALLKKLGNYLFKNEHKKFTIYVTREPCMMCFGAIMLSRISRVVYGCKGSNAGFSRYLNGRMPPFNREHLPGIVGNILENECKKLYKDIESN